jgi:Protein of unknown function (DUF1566)
MKRIIFTLSLLLALPANLLAAEVINLKVGQRGDKGFATYDLTGKIGEREAEVSVSLTINGERFPSDRLTLTGDFGKKIKTGVGKRIIWDILADIPTGFDGEVLWNVDSGVKGGPELPTGTPNPAQTPVTSQSAKDSPFEFSELVARDKNTGLLWRREVSKDGNVVDFNKARSTAARLATERFAGCADWKLPVADDLTKIVMYALEAGYKGKKSKGYPADYFNAIGFKGVANDYYWSAFANVGTGPAHTFRMAVDLEDGLTSEKNTKDYLQFWPVCKPD